MVKIAIAGGSGNVGQEVIDALVARNKHEILLLSRKDGPAGALPPGVRWVKADYSDVPGLTKALDGVHTVLSFVAGPADPKNAAQGDTQKNLIDASLQAGVKRFAPSEWTTTNFDHMFWFNYKIGVRDYLAEVNKDKKVLEYTLFQPGLFTNYLTYPFSSSKHVHLFETPINFHQRRALVVGGGEDAVITLTTAQDAAKVAALAIEYEGEWPIVGGIKGSDLTVRQIIELGEKVRGGPFAVERLKTDELKTGTAKPSWKPIVSHPSIPPEMRESAALSLVSGVLLAYSAGVFQVSDEWNRLLPDFEFTQPEEFLGKAWAEIDTGAKTVHTDY
ncbi:NmrA-like family protein [Colletotrichum sojae]|uniref:NmrA-like family protein n=1 Tax=Colletotrichum sojae TaxID=2175907 RepID=A0A8H6IUR2_9PEZI|nr:NmrA-like family protein [Colletotrichum sojae]